MGRLAFRNSEVVSSGAEATVSGHLQQPRPIGLPTRQLHALLAAELMADRVSDGLTRQPSRTRSRGQARTAAPKRPASDPRRIMAAWAVSERTHVTDVPEIMQTTVEPTNSPEHHELEQRATGF